MLSSAPTPGTTTSRVRAGPRMPVWYSMSCPQSLTAAGMYAEAVPRACRPGQTSLPLDKALERSIWALPVTTRR